MTYNEHRAGINKPYDKNLAGELVENRSFLNQSQSRKL